MKNHTIRYNYVKDTSNVGEGGGTGISLGCASDSLSDKSGNRVYCNIVNNATPGAWFAHEDQMLVYNNVFAYCEDGVQINRYYGEAEGVNLVMKNNIFYNNSRYHIHFSTNATSYILDSDYNLFYPTEGDVMRHQSAGGAMTIAEWQLLEGDGCTFDISSVDADPLFVNAANGNFQITSDSPAKDTGVDVGLRFDHRGGIVPYNSLFDIGAYEFGSSWANYSGF